MPRNVTDALCFISSSELYTSNYESYFNQVRYKELPAICLINSFMRHLYRRGFPQNLMAGPPPPSFLLQSYRYHRKPTTRQPACTWLGTKMGQKRYETRSCQRDPRQRPACTPRGRNEKRGLGEEVSGGRIGEPRTDGRQT